MEAAEAVIPAPLVFALTFAALVALIAFISLVPPMLWFWAIVIASFVVAFDRPMILCNCGKRMNIGDFEDFKKNAANRFAASDCSQDFYEIKTELEPQARKLLMAVIVIPVAFRTPLMPLHVPPLVVLRPAIFARFRQFVSRMLGLFAVPAMMSDGFV